MSAFAPQGKRVRLTMVADNRRCHVALVDPLPAGLEIVNPALAVSGSIPQDPNSSEARYGWWWWTWYEHQNKGDERAEAFTPLLWDGVYEYTYIARATTLGTFVVPPRDVFPGGVRSQRQRLGHRGVVGQALE